VSGAFGAVFRLVREAHVALDRGELPAGSRERLDAALARFDSVLAVAAGEEAAVDGEIEAARHLVPGSRLCGEAYFVTDGDPINTGAFSRTLVGDMELDPRSIRIPGLVARALATAGERVFQVFGKPKPPVSIVDVQLCVRDSYFSIDKARRDLEYQPLVDTREGLKRTARDAREYYDSL